MVIDALTVTGFVLSLAVLGAAYRGRSRLLDNAHWSCLTLTGGLSCAGVVGLVDGRTLGLSGLAFLICLQAIRAARYVASENEVGAEPAWWPNFERDFQQYTRQAPD
jgi:hypothetical protein